MTRLAGRSGRNVGGRFSFCGGPIVATCAINTRLAVIEANVLERHSDMTRLTQIAGGWMFDRFSKGDRTIVASSTPLWRAPEAPSHVT